MARAMGSSEAERAVRGEGAPSISFGGGISLPMFLVVGAGGGVAGSGGDLVPKASFTVRVKDGRDWTAARRLNEKLQDFLPEVQRNARLLNLIEEDELIERLQLPATHGSEPQELDVDATLDDVRICMGVGKVLLAVLAKPPPAAPIPATAPSRIPCNETTHPQTDGETSPNAIPFSIPSSILRNSNSGQESEDHGQVSATAPAGVVMREGFEAGTSRQTVRMRGSLPSSSTNCANFPAVPPSSGDGEGRVVFKKRRPVSIRLTEFDLSSDSHLTVEEKVAKLGISKSTFRKLRDRYKMGRWGGRGVRASLKRLNVDPVNVPGN